jgi:catechol 2,3-dioxygenase-like lactoylglutathione lyase family enzyme|tara:strand:- start:136 stop:558 length:423 start_codon:yes stop_codon:yes gene_type:complete
MIDKKDKIEIEFLDHVAIRVRDLEVSVKWYEEVLGLKKYQLPEWGDYPIFMLANKSGIALFPANIDENEIDAKSKKTNIDHFAFNVNKENFEKAKTRYIELNLDFYIKDHHYFMSIYTKDPDNHSVELTTILVDQDTFYE